MFKMLFSFILLLLLAGCAGTAHQSCREGGLCNNTDLVCTADNTCEYCGSDQEPCCAENSCDPSNTCLESTCVSCGQPDEPCCSGNTCPYADACVEGTCVACGSDGEACCPGVPCEDPYGCIEGVCTFCGLWEYPCCPGDSCTVGSCIDGKCTDCGKTDSACCPEDACNSINDQCLDGTCVNCGYIGGTCCPGDACPDAYGDWVCLADKCSACGYAGEACCAGDYCTNGACGLDKLCHDECGWADKACCEGEICAAYNFCDADNTCKSCGGLREQVCPDGTCGGWLKVENGVCANPFITNPETDASICMQGETEHWGRAYRIERSWCYWFAAYLKNDLSLCNSIPWNEMRDTCLEGDDPGSWIIFAPLSGVKP